MHLLLLLLLILPSFGNEKDKPYYEFFFTKLLTAEEKIAFLESFKIERVLNTLNGLIELFTKCNFYEPEIGEVAEKYNLDIGLIQEWQRTFYLSVYNEYKKTGIETQYFKDLRSNKSFNYLLTLDNEEEMENLFLYLNARELVSSEDEFSPQGLDIKFKYILSEFERRRRGGGI